MEDKNKKPVDKKELKKPSGKSATGKPLDGINVNPQLNDVSQQNEDAVVLTDPLNEKAALTFAQRQKRARILRAKEPKLQRAKEMAQHRLASKEKIEARAVAAARNIVKKRFASRRGVPYAELTTMEKIQVDTAVAKKTKLIRRIAARLLPQIRKAEFERLQSFKKGAPLQDLHTQKTTAEDVSSLYAQLDGASDTQLIDIIESSIQELETTNNTMSITLRRMLNAVIPSNVVNETLLKKSEVTGIPFSTLREVFERGKYAWSDDIRQTQEQYAFNRVNSYIAKGKAWNLDSDLREEKPVNVELNNAFNELLEKTNREIVDRPPPDQKIKRRQQEIQKKIIDEDTPSEREVGTKSLVKKYQSETPGQEKADLNESFNMAWTAGIGVTLTAADIGIQIKPGFQHHPDVAEEIERRGDYKMVKVRTPKGWAWKKVKKEVDIEKDAE